MDRQKLNELSSIVREIRRCLNFFQDNAELSLWIEDFGDNFAYIDNEKTGNRYMIKIEKVK